jgi:4-amino-4-deoxy-L-arabinose transferase-like glycosyltransferase
MMRFAAETSESRLDPAWTAALVIFFLGFCVHCTVFIGPHQEGDELIYTALVDQLDSGKGYTLLGSPILEQGRISKEQYGAKLFHHPPGGVGLFWLFHRMFGTVGYPLLQLFSYALFFWSMIFVGHTLGITKTSAGLLSLAGLAAFNPVLSHVITNYWLDGPLLAFSTCAVAVFIRAASRRNLLLALCAGVLLGYSGFIKQTVVLIIPGLALFTWFLMQPPRMRAFARLWLCLTIPALLVQVPWELWQWVVLGSPFSGRAGNPVESLLASNPYVYFVTVVRSPWLYVTLLPRVLWTIAPALILYCILLYDNKIRALGLALVVWIVTVLAAHILLGYMGYSKLIRYVILITPPAAILFSLLTHEAVLKLKSGGIPGIRKGIVVLVLAIATLAFLAEIAAGVRSAVLIRDDLIIPFVGTY